MKSANQEVENIMYIFNDEGLGGATWSLLDILEEIKDSVNPIVIIREDTNAEDKFAELGLRLYKIHFSKDHVRIGEADRKKRVQNIKRSYEAAMQLLPIIKKENVKLIHINSSTSYFAAIAALMAHVPYVWHIRELMEEQFNCEILNEELKLCLYKKADRLITISNYVKEKYCEKYALDTYRLYDGLNVARYKENIRLKKCYKNNFIVSSMITPEKGQWDVIRATEILVQRGYDDIKVNMVGHGRKNYVWALKKYIKRKRLESNIQILSFRDDLSLLYNQASYSITCSQNEALGRVTIEAMLAGNIVIGAKSGGTFEIIGENEERGFLYELGDSKSLADVMEKVINYDDERKNLLLQEAQIYAETTFDSRLYCKELLKIYNDVMHSFKPMHANDRILNMLKKYYFSVKDSVDCETRSGIVSNRKSTMMFHFVLRWLEILQTGHSVREFFKKNNIHDIAIYGMGVLGCRLYDELENSNIQVKYLIDRNPKGMDEVFKFSYLDREKLDVDAIIVTVISSEIQIINEIKTYGYKKVIGLSEIISDFEEYV